jgi:predicted nucleic acid-binding protein
MSAVRFLDTNILLYAYDLDAPTKRVKAMQLVEQGWTSPGETAISVQVLQEMHVNLAKRGVSPKEAARIVTDFETWHIVDNTMTLLRSAMDEQIRWKISLWDSLILAAARASGATELLTEDLNHGQDYGGVTVINPFR